MFSLLQKLSENGQCLCCIWNNKHQPLWSRSGAWPEFLEHKGNFSYRVHVRSWTKLGTNACLFGEFCERLEHGGSCWTTSPHYTWVCNRDRRRSIKAPSLCLPLLHCCPFSRIPCIIPKIRMVGQNDFVSGFSFHAHEAFKDGRRTKLCSRSPCSTNYGNLCAVCSVLLCSKVGVTPSIPFLRGV